LGEGTGKREGERKERGEEREKGKGRERETKLVYRWKASHRNG